MDKVKEMRLSSKESISNFKDLS